MAAVSVKDGDWFVEQDWKFRVRQAVRVTNSLVFYMGEKFNVTEGTQPAERRVRLDKVVFSCRSELIAKSVAAALTSSAAQCDLEQREADGRRDERDKQILEQATKAGTKDEH